MIAGFLALTTDFGGFAGSRAWHDFLTTPLAFAFGGYLVGGLPALLAGFLSGAVSGWVGSKLVWVLLATMAGAVSAALFAEILWGSMSDQGVFILMFAGLGAAGALAAALIAVGLRPRWSN